MWRSWFLSLGLALLALAACAAPAPAIFRETVLVEVTLPPPPTYTPLAPLPTYTLYPTYTAPAPTATPTTSVSDEPPWIRDNVSVAQDRGGVTIDVRHVMVGDKAYIHEVTLQRFDDHGEAYRAATLVGQFILIVRNTTDGLIHVYPDRGTVIVRGPSGARQIDITGLAMGMSRLEEISGGFYPGVTAVGGFWFPLPPGMEMEDVQVISLAIAAPTDREGKPMGDDYLFEFDLSSRPYEMLDASHLEP